MITPSVATFFPAVLALFAAEVSEDSPSLPAHAELIDGDAPFVVRADFADLVIALSAAAGASSRLGAVVTAGRTLIRARHDFDPLSAEDWRAAGFDPGSPMFASALAGGGGDRERASRAERHAQAVWRSRLALPVTDRDAAAASIDRWARSVPGVAAASDGGAASSRAEEETRLTPDGEEPIAAGRIGDTQIGVRATHSEHGIAVDVLIPGSSPGDRAHRRAAHRAPSALPREVTRAVRGQGLRLRIAPLEAYDALTGAFGQGASLPPGCRGLSRLAAHGAIADVSLALRAREQGAGLQAGGDWRVRPESKLVGLLEAGSFISLPPARGDIALAWSWQDPAALRELPRPTGPARLPGDLRRLAAACGPGGKLVFWLFAWPEVGAAFFDALVGIGPRAEALARAAGPGSAAVRSVSPDYDTLVAGAEIAVPERATQSARGTDPGAIAEILMSAVFGDARPGPPGVDRVWGRGRILPYRRDLSAASMAFGAGRGEPSLRWYTNPDTARATPPDGALLWGRGSAEAIAAIATQRGVPGAPWLDRAGRELGEVEARVSAGEDRVRLRLALELDE